MNPLESLFNRLDISGHYGQFLSKGINNISQLRALDAAEIANITKNRRVCDKLFKALSNGSVSVPGAVILDQLKRSKRDVIQFGKQNVKKNSSSGKELNVQLGDLSSGSTINHVSTDNDNWATKGKGKSAKTAKPSSKIKRNGVFPKEHLEIKNADSTSLGPVDVDLKGISEEAGDSSGVKKTVESTKPERCKNTDAQLSITLSDKQIAFLFAEKGVRLREIHEKHGTSNQRIFSNKADHRDSVSFSVYGPSLEKCAATKEAIEKLVGITKQKEEDARFHYYMNEVKMNTQAMLYIMQKNLYKVSYQLGDDSLRGIASYLNFEKRVGVEHFVYFCKNDKVKKGILDMLIEQFGGGIQMIIYCNGKQAPLLHEHLVKNKISSQVKPILLIPATKEDRKDVDAAILKQRRQDALQGFKRGTAAARLHECHDGKKTVLQRLLIATDDYARYARTREIPYVNLVIHYSPPKQREWSIFRSETVARGERTKERDYTIGYELTLFSESESALVEELKHFVSFKKIPHEEEQEYFHKWSQTLTPETSENPQVDYTKVEPMES